MSTKTAVRQRGDSQRRTRAKKAKKAAKVQQRPPAFQGWNTSDDDEIARRQWRGLTEITAVETIEPDRSYFGTFRVRSASARSYRVEIRALTRRENSCDCLDWQVNGLGTCKHIEGVLAFLARKGKRAFRAAAKAGNDRVEVFPAPSGEVAVKVRWPPDSPAAAALSEVVDGEATVMGDPLNGVDVVRERLAQAGVREVRVSSHLEARLERQRRRRRRLADRDAFLAEVETGTASLDVLHHPLLPYQHEGMLHLAFGERTLLADEMGLGKTVQAIAACELLRRRRGISRVLVVLPASLKAEWEDQIARFTGLSTHVVSGRRAHRLQAYASEAFFLLVNYEQVRSDVDDINRIAAPDVVVLDEAQRIKNWQTKTARSVKALRSPYAIVLTGTPLENRIDEVYSIVQYLDPWLLGPLFRFNREFYVLDERGRPVDYRNLETLHARLAPVMLRRRKDQVDEQLPGRTTTSYFVSMTEEQKLRYQDYEARAARLIKAAQRRQLTPEEFDRLQQWLACMRMICDSPYILDPDCHDAPKLTELEAVIGDLLAEPATKVIVFSEWERMLSLVGELVAEMGFEFAWHTGTVPQDRRRREIRRFKQDPQCRLLLSTNSGGLGLNLQVASAVINVDLPWNPAQLEQRIARAWRRDQTRAVSVVNLICENSIEHRIQHIVEAKRDLADGVLDGRGDLAALKMPSGRAAMVERMAAMMQPVEAPADAGPAPGQRFAATVTAQLEAVLLAMAGREREGGDATALVVLERTPGESDMERIGEAARDAGLKSVETIDRATWDNLRRLEEAGLVRLSDGMETLYSSPQMDGADVASEETARRQKLAGPWLELGERKLRMAVHLAEGGFQAEAAGPLAEAAALGVRALAVMHDSDLDPDEVERFSAVELSERSQVHDALPAGSVAALSAVDTPGDDAFAANRSTTQRLIAAAQAALQRGETGSPTGGRSDAVVPVRSPDRPVDQAAS